MTPRRRVVRVVAAGLVVGASLAACAAPAAEAPAPAAPVVAAPPGPARPLAEACGEMITLVERYLACVPDERIAEITAWRDRARIDLAAAGADGVSPADRDASARACDQASVSLRARLEACPPGP
jgi:hypothetical protein